MSDINLKLKPGASATEKSVLEYASSFVLFGGVTAFACMFANPAVTHPELFQDDYGLMQAIHTHPFYVWAHLIQIVCFMFMFVGLLTVSFFSLGLIEGSNITVQTSEKGKFKALFLLAVSLLSAGLAINFLVVDGFGFKEVASRLIERNIDEVQSVYYAADVLGIDNGFMTAMMIFWGGITPMMLGWVVREWHPSFKMPALSCMVFGGGALMGGLGYTVLFFANMIALSEGNKDMEPYYAATTIMFVFAGLSMLSAAWLGGSIWTGLKKLRNGEGPLTEEG